MHELTSLSRISVSSFIFYLELLRQRDSHTMYIIKQSTLKVLPQNTLKRNQLQLLPYLSYGSEIVHPIAEQSDEQFANESSGGYSLRDSYSPLLTRKNINDANAPSNTRDRSLSAGRFEDRFTRYYSILTLCV